jgi:hypothetical protein
MKLSLEPTMTTMHDVSAETLGLAAWYDSQPEVRRLWGIRDAQKLRVVVSVDATHDNGDVLPIWLGRCGAWAQELRQFTGAAVQLQLFDELVLVGGLEIASDAVVIADLYWRDPTLNLPNEVL